MSVVASFPLTALQQGMLFEHLSGARAGVDVEQIVVDFERDPDVARLGQALARVVERHDALRSSFRWEGLEAPVQEVHSAVDSAIAVESLAPSGNDENGAVLREWLERDRKRGFDPAAQPLLRATVLRSGHATATLVLTSHHLLMDGRSFPRVLSELFLIYDALGDGSMIELATARSCREHAEFLAQRDVRDDDEFWRGQLAGLSRPTDPAFVLSGDAPAVQQPERGEHDGKLSASTTARLRDFSRRNGISLATLVHGAWALVLARTSGEDDVVFGCVRACRHSSVPRADEIVGMFINTLPLRVRVDPRALLTTWLADLHASQRAIAAREQASLATIQRHSEIPPGTPLFRSIVVYDHEMLDAQVRRSIGREVREVRRFELFERTGLPLTLYAYGEPELRLKLAWDSDYLRRDDALRLFGHVAALLEAFASDPERTLGEIAMVTGDERETLLRRFNDTRCDYARDATIPSLFEQQVARTPDARALVCEGESLTYRELDERANALAAEFQSLGVGPEVLVGLCLERSLDLVVAVLAVHKAGGAYLPLDPSYPSERLAFLIGDARATVLATQRHLAGVVPPGSARVLFVDEMRAPDGGVRTPKREIGPRNLAYVLYTSGSTGVPKGCVHFHRDILASADAYARHVLAPSPDDRFGGHPTLAFTFGTGGLLVFPFRFGASTVLSGPFTPESMLETFARQRVTIAFCAPTSYRLMLDVPELKKRYDLASLRTGVSAAEPLPAATWKHWRETTGIELLDGIGSTEMFHIFISSQHGLGRTIFYAGSTYEIALVWVAVFVLSTLAVIMYAVVSWLENVLRKGTRQ